MGDARDVDWDGCETFQGTQKQLQTEILPQIETGESGFSAKLRADNRPSECS